MHADRMYVKLFSLPGIILSPFHFITRDSHASLTLSFKILREKCLTHIYEDLMQPCINSATSHMTPKQPCPPCDITKCSHFSKGTLPKRPCCSIFFRMIVYKSSHTAIHQSSCTAMHQLPNMVSSIQALRAPGSILFHMVRITPNTAADRRILFNQHCPAALAHTELMHWPAPYAASISAGEEKKIKGLNISARSCDSSVVQW